MSDKQIPSQTQKTLQSNSFRALFFERCNTMETQVETFKGIWKNLDENTKCFCLEHVISESKGFLNNDDSDNTRLSILRKLLYNEGVYSFLDYDSERLYLFEKNSEFVFEYAGCGLICDIPGMKKVIPDFKDALEQLDFIQQHRKEELEKQKLIEIAAQN